MWSHLRTVLATATEVDIAVSFVMVSGINLIFDDLKAALDSERKVRLRLLTSDYLLVTQPPALSSLLFLVEAGADVRIYQCERQSFHLKSYLFIRREHDVVVSADAFVGSSNISRPALLDGLEWNYHIDYPNSLDLSAKARIEEVQAAFEGLFADERVVALTPEWLESYKSRWSAAQTAIVKNEEKELVVATVKPNEIEKPEPHPHQDEALQALAATRLRGYQKGLVVLATGLGKTYLAAFDAEQVGANRVLFIAHREEILTQAERSFLAVLSHKRIGRYSGTKKDRYADLLFSSVQTIGRAQHLQHFAPDHFDYIVIDEFHHAAAGQYQALLKHFKPKFMLGLTATPDRSDRLDILRFCDHNLVFRFDLFDGIRAKKLCPFHYYGILDTEVDYDHIPWRNGRFDPNKLANKLATVGRAKHVLKEWRSRGKLKTLAFCVSKKHADYMADYFRKEGIKAASVHTDSGLSRSEALDQLKTGELTVLFSVDLFNEGVDLPSIDTVMMLRPTESSVLFLQQLGRGLRTAEGKPFLTVLDFVGNHHSFKNRPGLVFDFPKKPTQADMLAAMREPNKFLPEGCFANYDLEFIEFVASKESSVLVEKYWELKTRYERRPTLLEMWRSGVSMSSLGKQYGSWWEFLDHLEELRDEELAVLEPATQWFRDLTDEPKALEPLMQLSALMEFGISEAGVAENRSAADVKGWLSGQSQWVAALTDSEATSYSAERWQTYLRRAALTTLLSPTASGVSLLVEDEGLLYLNVEIASELWAQFRTMSSDILGWRLAIKARELLPEPEPTLPVVADKSELLYFPHIQMACGHFRNGHAGDEQFVRTPEFLKGTNLDRLFVARAKGNSMNGGKSPIYDGDYLLFEYITPETAGKISDQVVAIERQDVSGDDQYLLRRVLKQPDGSYLLRANNPDYADMIATDEMVTFARLKSKVDPLKMFVGQAFMREEIPALFGVEYQAGSWASGYVPITGTNKRVMLVTINSNRGGQDTYANYFVDQHVFHWQSQNSTTPDSKRGKEITTPRKVGVNMYLFVRENRLQKNGKAAPFVFYGEVDYISHSGSEPIDVNWRLLDTTYNAQ